MKLDYREDRHRNPVRPIPFIIAPDRILVTGATGFIGSRVVESLVGRGFRNVVCFARPSSDLSKLEAGIKNQPPDTRIEVLRGNLLSRADCEAASKKVSVIYHLAAGTGEKSFPDAFMNSVVTTRNLLEATAQHACLKRFVVVSSLAVYSNRQKSRRLDESCPVEAHPERSGSAYCYAKVKQEQIVTELSTKFAIPYVIVRPGSVYGPGHAEITARVGIRAFGPFLHFGGFNSIPFTYVDNCAEAIVLAGLVSGVEGETFNVIDDDTPSSRRFLKAVQAERGRFQVGIRAPPIQLRALLSVGEILAVFGGTVPACFQSPALVCRVEADEL